MGQMKDYTGLRFGRLVVTGRSEKKGSNGDAYWECRCDCGNSKTVSMTALNRGYTKSCGCLKRELLQNNRHKDRRLYQVWQDMKQRCFNPRNKFYHRYGGRGITVCSEWLEDYDVFYNWAMQNGYQRGLQIDRINGDGNYEPSNCRWATPKVNTDNRDATKMLTYNGKTQSLTDWSRETGVPLTTIRQRLSRGLSEGEILGENKHPPITITYNGETKTLVDWCRALDLPYDRTKARFYAGKSPEEILKP